MAVKACGSKSEHVLIGYQCSEKYFWKLAMHVICMAEKSQCDFLIVHAQGVNCNVELGAEYHKDV